MAKGKTRQKQESKAPKDRPSRRVRQINRREATQNLEPPGLLPTELWLDIIGKYSGSKELLALCKTSRFFHKIARIWLYKRLSLDAYHKAMNIRLRDPRASLTLFEETYKARPELGPLIEDLCICRAQHSPFPLHAFPLKIHQLPNLGRLLLAGCRVNADLRDAIHSCLCLRVLEFKGCELDKSHLTERTQHYPQSSIVDLMIFGEGFSRSVLDDRWATFAPAGLQSFTLSFNSRIDSSAILSNIIAPGSILEKLTISSIPSSIVRFLVSSTRLRHLRIYSLLNDRDLLMFSSLPGDAIPLLEQYYGPAGLSPILLRNRPVHSVALNFYPGQSPSAEILDSMQSSLVPVTTLKFMCTLEGDWLSHIPITICHLSFKPGNSAIIDESSLPALSRLTNLRTIQVTVDLCMAEFWEASNREGLLTLAESFPSLREVEIGDYGKWIMVKPMVWNLFKYIQGLWRMKVSPPILMFAYDYDDD